MKEIIKTAIQNYITSLTAVLIFISSVAIIQANAVLQILLYAFWIFIVTEIIVFILNKLIKFIFILRKKSNDNNG